MTGSCVIFSTLHHKHQQSFDPHSAAALKYNDIKNAHHTNKPHLLQLYTLRRADVEKNDED